MDYVMYFKTDASKRRYLNQQRATLLYKDAPEGLQDRYEIFMMHGDVETDVKGYYYPKTFSEWLGD